VAILKPHDMAMSFTCCARMHDLVLLVRNYFLGKEPLPFDSFMECGLRRVMPAAMHSFYLRNMYHMNLLAKPGGLRLSGVPLDLSKSRRRPSSCSARRITIAP